MAEWLKIAALWAGIILLTIYVTDPLKHWLKGHRHMCITFHEDPPREHCGWYDPDATSVLPDWQLRRVDRGQAQDQPRP